MSNSIAFAPALSLPLRVGTPRRCARSQRVPVAMRVVGDPERSKDNVTENDGERLVGNVVPPNDFEDSDTKHSADFKADLKGVAGIANENDSLLEENLSVDDHQINLNPESDKTLEPQNETAKAVENISTAPDAIESKSSKEAIPTSDAEQALKGPEEENSNSMKTSVKMTPEQIEKAKAAREAAVKAAEELDAKKAEQRKQILAKAESIFQKVGQKSKAFEIGENARTKAEVFVEDLIKNGAEKEASQQEKLKGSAASAAKSLVATITKGWEETVAPKIRDTLPSEYKEVSNKVLASAAVGLFVAVALLPSLFSGGQEKAKDTSQRKIDAETVMLEKKLQQEKGALSSYGSRSASQKAVFPSDENPTSTTETSKARSASKVTTEKPSSKVAETQKQVLTTPSTPSLPPASLSSTPKPEAAVPPPAPVAVTPPPAAPKPVESVKQRETQPAKPVEVTPAIVMTSIAKALGPNANLISAASFDTLAPQPTIVLEVSKAYHVKPAIEQKKLAQIMLQSGRELGYERISLIEVGTGVEVAHAGLDVDLEDETENLRAQVGSLQKLSDKLAMQSANKEAEIDKLNTRIAEEREEFALQQMDLEKRIKTLREENAGLVEDLGDAKAEIAKMPDRMALEERTVEAERKSEKLTDTVEMLSIQLSKARNDEAIAQKSQAQSIESSNKAIKEKDEALASVAGQIQQAQEAANARANERIAAVEKDTKTSVDDANKRVSESEAQVARTIEESKAAAQESRRSFEQQLNDQKERNEKEVQTIQSKYEAMLEEVQKRAQNDLDAFQKEADRKLSVAVKEAKAFSDSLTKERDDALRSVQKVEKQAEKAADKAEREKQGLQKKINKLEATLNQKAPVQEEQPVGAESTSDR